MSWNTSLSCSQILHQWLQHKWQARWLLTWDRRYLLMTACAKFCLSLCSTILHSAPIRKSQDSICHPAFRSWTCWICLQTKVPNLRVVEGIQWKFPCSTSLSTDLCISSALRAETQPLLEALRQAVRRSWLFTLLCNPVPTQWCWDTWVKDSQVKGVWLHSESLAGRTTCLHSHTHAPILVLSSLLSLLWMSAVLTAASFLLMFYRSCIRDTRMLSNFGICQRLTVDNRSKIVSLLQLWPWLRPQKE
jgi:hypothetical protein